VPGGLLLTLYALLVFGAYIQRLAPEHAPAALGSDQR
jgi:hypothetical protein